MTGDSAGTLMVSPVVRFLITPSSGLTSSLSPSFDLVHVVADFQQQQPHVEGVAVEDAGEAVRDDGLHARAEDGDGGVLAGRSATEVALGHEDVAHLHALDPAVLKAFHAVFAELLGIGRHKETGRDDGVGIDMFADFMRYTSERHMFLL